jgi:WD40 repeat protein/thiol-disulfide isomerase/thioredoxin
MNLHPRRRYSLAAVGYVDVVAAALARFGCAAALIVAAALKMHLFITGSALGVMYGSRWLQAGTIEYELLLGTWLLSGSYSARCRALSMFTFGGFGGYSLYLALSGALSCSCFGGLQVNPWWTVALDVILILSLWRSKPFRTAGSCGLGSGCTRIGRPSITPWISIFVASLGLSLLVFGSKLIVDHNDDGDINDDRRTTVLRPEKWVGKRFPIFDDIDINDVISSGSWIVVFYHHDCTKCREAIPKYEGLAEELGGADRNIQIALIQVPPYASAEPVSRPALRYGKLSDRKEWLVATPSEVWITDGRVTAAPSGDNVGDRHATRWLRGGSIRRLGVLRRAGSVGQSPLRMVPGLLADSPAAVLTRGVWNSVLPGQLGVATVVICLGIGGGLWDWHVFASAVDEKVQTDRYGDPLPPGAATRLGTVRFREFPWIDHLVYSPDGQIVVTDSLQDYLQVWDARDGKKLRRIGAGMEQVRDFAFSPDGTLIGALGYRSVPQRLKGVAQLTFVDVATGRLVRRAEWDFEKSERSLAFAPDGNTVATETDDGTLRLWDVATAKLLHQRRLGGQPNFASIAFSPDAASHLLAIASDRAIHVWNTSNLRDARTFAIEGEDRPTGLAFSPDGMTLAAGIKTVGAEVLLWKVGDGSLLRRFKSRKSTSVCHVLFSPNGNLLAAVGFQGPVVLFDARSGEELDAHVKEFGLVSGAFDHDNPMAFSPDGRTLATLGGPQALHFWDLATGKDRLATPEAHLGAVHALTFPPDGKTVISGSDDRTVRIWNLATGRPTKTLSHNGPVWSLAVSADGVFLAAGLNFPKEVHLWNLKTSERLHTWPVASESLRGVTLSGDGSSVIVALADGSFRCWDLLTGKERALAQPNLKGPLDAAVAATLPPVTHTTRLAAFSRDGRSKAIVRTIPGRAIKLASGEIRQDRSSAGSTIVWLDSQTGHVRREIEIPQSDVQRLAFSPDGQSIAVGYFSTLHPPARGFICIVRLRDKRGLRTIESPCAWIDSLCFTPESKQIVAGLQDTSIVIWDVLPTD